MQRLPGNQAGEDPKPYLIRIIMMNFKNIALILMVGLVLCLSGCASILTGLSPRQSKIVEGEKTVGSLATYDYQFDIRSDKIFLSRIPLCNETVKTVRVAQKREIGYISALLEMPFFGLGLLDIINANAISEASRQEYPLGTFNTGKLLACGLPEPAVNETLIIRDPTHRLSRNVSTGKNGVVDLKEALSDVKGVRRLEIYLAADPGVACSYDYTPGRLAENRTGNFPQTAN